ncbi:MAG TPA: PEP-CTERM sorting domain-containing protein [Leptolyngbyaceae cyanobacterium]
MKNAFSTIIKTSLLAATVSIASSFVASPASAFQFGFNNITNNDAANKATGENQLFIDVLDAAGGENLNATQALFKFSNVGPKASSITQIYFDNSDVLKNIFSIADSGDGVSFEIPRRVGNLPGGNSLTNRFEGNFSIEPAGATAPNGVNPGEWVSVLFNLNPGKTLQNVFNDLTSGALRVGFHVQAFGNGGSEAFVNKPTVVQLPPVEQPQQPVEQPQQPVEQPQQPVEQPPAPTENRVSVPEPTTIGGLALITAALGLSRRKFNKKS